MSQRSTNSDVLFAVSRFVEKHLESQLQVRLLWPWNIELLLFYETVNMELTTIPDILSRLDVNVFPFNSLQHEDEICLYIYGARELRAHLRVLFLVFMCMMVSNVWLYLSWRIHLWPNLLFILKRDNCFVCS